MKNSVERGIDHLLRLDFPISNDELDVKRHTGRTVDALEMFDALEAMRDFFEETRGCIGKPMYKKEKEFDFIHDIKEDIKGYFLTGDDSKDSALRRRKYHSMVFLMLNPIVNLFHRDTHKEALERYNSVIDECIEYIKNNESNASAVDAFVVRRLIQKAIQRRNRVEAAVDGIMRLRNRKKRRKKKKKKKKA